MLIAGRPFPLGVAGLQDPADLPNMYDCCNERRAGNAPRQISAAGAPGDDNHKNVAAIEALIGEQWLADPRLRQAREKLHESRADYLKAAILSSSAWTSFGAPSK